MTKHTLGDFLAAAKTLARSSTGGEVMLVYFDAFQKYANFEAIPDAELRALKRNIGILPAEGFHLATREDLTRLVENMEHERLAARRSVDDISMDPLIRRSYETEEEYVSRISRVHPLIPHEFVRDFLFRHNSYAIGEHAWIEYGAAGYRVASWELSRILSEISHPNQRGVEMEVVKFRTEDDYRNEYPLAAYMLREGTWPTPVPVIDNGTGILTPDGRPIGRYELLDGMHRFGFLLAMNEMQIHLQPVHTIILITLPA